MLDLKTGQQGYESFYEDWTEAGRLDAEQVAAIFVSTSKRILEERGKRDDEPGMTRFEES
jgi:hypothetical protein